MTKVKVLYYDDIKVKSDGLVIWLTVPGGLSELDLTEASDLIAALEQHIEKIEEGR